MNLNPNKRKKLFFWAGAAVFVFLLINSVDDFKAYQDKAKAEAAEQKEKK